MENKVLSEKSPLYGRRDSQIKLDAFDHVDAAKKAVKPHLHSFMGSVFEDMCRYYTLQHGILEEFDCFIRNRKKAVIGECKFKNEKIDKGIYETLIRRFHLITAKYRIVKYILFSLSGYTDWFDTLYDDNVVLLSIDDLYQ